MIECDECGTKYEPMTDTYTCPECGTSNYPDDADYRKEIDAIMPKGRRCPLCQGFMIHTRLGGYRCQRGCQ